MAAPTSIGDRSYGIIAVRRKPGHHPIAATTAFEPTKFNSQVLLIYQKTILGPPLHPNFWHFPKGHSEANDSSVQATAIRELREETGLVVNEDDIILGNEEMLKEVYINPVRTVGKEVRYWVALVGDGDKEVKVQEKEVADARWCDWEEALKLLTFEETRAMFRKVIERLGVVERL